MSLKKSILEFSEKNLNKLKEEISLYVDEKSIWSLAPGISNCGGNLCLHLIGNQQHFIGSVLGKTGYIRNRDAEFSTKNVSRAELISQIEDTLSIVMQTLNQIPESDFEKNYPAEFLGNTQPLHFALIHLIAHFNYHLGQINYHRRLISE